ncbi:MAG: hypothetical protein AAGF94_18650 [Pseudomonadota bacterium]
MIRLIHFTAIFVLVAAGLAVGTSVQSGTDRAPIWAPTATVFEDKQDG